MSFEEIRRIQNLLKQLRELRGLLRGLGGRSQSEKQEMTIHWLNEHGPELDRIPSDQLNELREAAEYDEAEWNALLQKLKDPECDDRSGQ